MKKQIFMPQHIKRIQKLIDAQPNLSRNQLSREVCRLFNWRSANGSLKEVSCRKKLLELQRRGKIRLPKAQKTLQFSGKGEKALALSYEPQPIDCELPELGKVKLLPVSGADRDNSRLWNGLMERYHYLGAGPLCGAQLRYLIDSSQRGIVGGLSFSAAAWRLEARDRWIGWDDLARRNQLGKVVCNSRFLILPTVQVKNLASHVLGLAPWDTLSNGAGRETIARRLVSEV